MWHEETIGTVTRPDTFLKLNENSYLQRRNLQPHYEDGQITHWTSECRIISLEEYNELIVADETSKSISDSLDTIMFALADIYERLGVR